LFNVVERLSLDFLEDVEIVGHGFSTLPSAP
jgi:hypothetical protein